MKTVIDFYADWCGPCNAMKPGFHAVQEKLKSKLTFKEVNVDTEQNEAMKFGIMSIPTLVVLDENGNEIDRRMGAMSQSQLESWLNQYL